MVPRVANIFVAISIHLYDFIQLHPFRHVGPDILTDSLTDADYRYASALVFLYAYARIAGVTRVRTFLCVVRHVFTAICVCLELVRAPACVPCRLLAHGFAAIFWFY